jgi:hypothetical protein
LARKTYLEDRSRDVLITDQMARLGSDANVWWISDLDRAVVQTVFQVRWDIVLWAAIGGALCVACLLVTEQSLAGAALVLLLAVLGGVAVALVSANFYRVRLRTRRWAVHHALDSASKTDVKEVVDAVNKAIKEYREGYNQPPPREDVPL